MQNAMTRAAGSACPAGRGGPAAFVAPARGGGSVPIYATPKALACLLRTLAGEGAPMRVAVTSQGRDLSSEVDRRFGRAKCFVVVDTESGDFTAADNSQNFNAPQGAGIQAGKNVVDLGVEAVITGHVGPKAWATLQAGGVAIYTGATGTVADAIEQFKAGKLERSSEADVEGHWV